VSILDGQHRDLGERLAQAVDDGQINRRQLIARASAAGLSFTAIGALLSACGGGGGGGGEDKAAAETTGKLSSAPITLGFINYDWPPAHALQEFAAREYKKVRPNVTIKTDVVPIDQWHDAIFTQFAARKTTFDIPVLDSQMIGEAVQNGDILNLTDFVAKNIDTSAYPTKMMATYGQYPQSPSGEYEKGSKLYGLPLQGDSYGYFWRKDLLGEEPPATWDDMVAAAKEYQASKKGKQFGLGIHTAPGDGSATTYTITNWVHGGEIWDSKNRKVQGVINNAAGKKAMDFLINEMMPLMPKGASTWFVNELNTAMAQDQMLQGFQWFAAMGGAVDPKGSKLGSTQAEILKKVGVAPLPKHVKDTVVQGGMGMHISSYGPNQAEALNFMKWFHDPKTQLEVAKVPGLVPGRTDALESQPFLDGAPWNPAFVESLPRLKDLWNIPEYSKLLDIAGTRVNAAMTGTEDPMKALDQIASDQQKVLDGNGGA
jgi:multiple sugar transport system substrate-binding protein